MNRIQQWVAIAAAIIVAVLVAGWFVVVTPQRALARDLEAQAVTQRSGTASLRTQLHVLEAQSKQLPAKQAELATFGKQIPSSPLLPAVTRSLTAAAASAGVDLISIGATSPTATIVGAPSAAGVPAPAVASPGAPGAPGAAAGAAPATPAAATPATPATPAAPAAAVSALQSITITLKVRGSYAQLEQLVANLEGLQRVMVVSGYSLGVSTGCSGTCALDLDLTAQVFTTPALAAEPLAVPVPKTVK